MTEAINNKNLVERFSSYVNHMKEKEKEKKQSSAFTDKLAQKSDDARQGRENPEAGVKRRSTPMIRMSARAGRRSQPPLNLPNQKGQMGQPRTISKVHAHRLAKYAPIIEFNARKYNVPVELICGVILQESGGNSRAVSHCGAQGLMQLMPGTAKRFGVKNSFDPVQNIEGGTKYLRFLLDKFNGRLDLALAGYNAGEHNVTKYGNKIPPFAETRGYVPAVLGYTQAMVNIFASRTQTIPYGARRV